VNAQIGIAIYNEKQMAWFTQPSAFLLSIDHLRIAEARHSLPALSASPQIVTTA
jgi:hypothetical protein